MDFHLERGLRLNSESKYKNLYTWAINEIDAQGQTIGNDQIPWTWTLDFTATSCLLRDSFEVERSHEPTSEQPRIEQRQVINVKLRPGRLGDDDYYRDTTYSMFGTDRAIKSFDLGIYPVSEHVDGGRCTAWGSVSYTAELDFRDETTDDCIVFYLYVEPETFAGYVAKISQGLVDEIIFTVSAVDGFYAEWSPMVSTRKVKVLTRGGEQKMALPPGHTFEPPRLGDVGEAKLYINRRLEFRTPTPEPDDAENVGHTQTERVTVDARPAAVDPKMLQTLASLRRAAWYIVGLLALIVLVLLGR